nr:muscle M-line assembly protein unc-89-like isoform X2 [Rhipicephalus microplus]
MDNLTRIEEDRRRGNSPYKTATTIAAVVAICEFFEVWSFGWTLLTFLVPESLGNLHNTTSLGAEFEGISLRYEYTFCVVAILVFQLLYLFSAAALIWSNKNDKATAFPLFVFTSVVSLLQSVTITIYFFATSEMIFTYFFEPENETALAFFLIFLYFSRYFFLGWIVKLAIVMCVHKRKEEIDSEKESIDIQTAVDKAFKSVFDPEPEEPHVRPEAIPETVRPIPRVTAAATRKEPDDMVPRSQPSNGHLNRAYERDPEERPPRQDARNQETSREPRYAKENCEPRAAAPRVENSEPPRREERRRGDGWREEKEFLQARDRRRAPRDTRDDYPMQEYSRRERSPENFSGRPQTPAAEDGDRLRESRFQMHGPGSRLPSAPEDVHRPSQEYELRSPPYDKRQEYYPRAEDEQPRRAAEPRRRQVGDLRRGDGGAQVARQDESRNRDKPRPRSEYDYNDARQRAARQPSPTDYDRWDGDYEGRSRPQPGNDSRRPMRWEPEHDDYGQREVRPRQRMSAGSPRSSYEDYEANRSRRPAEDYGLERSSKKPVIRRT